MDKKGEINELSKIVKPQTAVITNISEAHLENFNSLKEIALAKSEIFTAVNSVKTLIINRQIDNFSTIKSLAKKKSIKNHIDPKITNRIWKNMIWSYINFEKNNFKKK